MNDARSNLQRGLRLIFEGIEYLRNSCGNSRQFTIDGRLVGDIGEIVAAREFEIILDERSRDDYDAKTLGGSDVQIQATFQNDLTFKKSGGLYLGLKLSPDGSHEVVFNGPARFIAEEYAHRKGLGEKLLSFPVARLREIAKKVPQSEKISERINI
jgi:hypothetical protein